MKIHVRRSALGSRLFADYYSAEGSGGLVVWFGGAVPRRVYEERRETEPTPVLDCWQAACVGAGIAADLLVVPSPTAPSRDLGFLRQAVRIHLVHELLPAAGVSLGTDVACAGLSFGALLATAVAIELPACCRVVTIGGVGMSEMAATAGPDLFARCRFLCLTNHGDPMQPQSFRFQAVAALRGAAVEVRLGAGGHDFSDYATNGSVEAGFRFLLEGLRPAGSPS